ncbi:AAA family ATPase [Paenisporosarcina quisquiliarum]|uniref:Nuclease SbcCD subunit C n=1 Tax=Paenisporosarcina quisquiliarum TaxID=365346 RepID=A0A9X3RF50_9BACL|nr:AAA family ATPase [Paenisporosarcina quisquiliarum]MCZ8538292.1 AAA family ATPase [Paenisporosarcina quisquiliarum]
MLIQYIKLKNFRQYYQEQTIEFSRSANRNVTVIHGENGSGKTALLNAFSWCLYGLHNLPNEKDIINEHAIAIAIEEVEGSVTINFIDSGKEYTVTRKVRAKKSLHGEITYFEPEVQVNYIEKGGLFKTVNNPTVELNRILPEDLRTYFFFDGERIDNLSKESGTEDIKKAIKNIMGLEILERAITHTEKARIRFRSELKKFGNSLIINIIEELDKLEGNREELKEQEILQKSNLSALDKQILAVETRLKQIEGAKQLQSQRDNKQTELLETKQTIKDIRRSLKEKMSKIGYIAFSYSATQKADTIIKKNSAGDVFTGVSSVFIEELISKGQCICGSSLTSNSIHLDHLKLLKDRLNLNNYQNNIYEMVGNLKVIKERKINLISELKRLKKNEITEIQKVNMLSEELDEISSKLTGKESEEIVQLENKRVALVNQKSLVERRLGVIENDLETVLKNINEKTTEQKKYQILEEKGLLTQKRMDALQQLEIVMQEILKVREKLVKSQLQERITKVYSQFLRKGYDVQLADNYELNVLNENKNIVGMSQGERQITSLSFIGAIVDIAREHYKDQKVDFDEGGIYPLVMDSPFGALDSDHRERIANGIYKLADQVVVIVSSSQWKGEVSEHLKDYIGKEYKLLYNDPRQNKVRPYEYTEVVEVVSTNV